MNRKSGGVALKSDKEVINKIDLKAQIEPFIYERLDNNTYEIEVKSACSLLRWNRLDLAFKLCYLDNKKLLPEFAGSVYFQDIYAQGLGSFTEVGNNAKNSFEAYKDIFDKLMNSIASNGFSSNISLIPLANDGSIYNGAHRTACAIACKKNIATVKLDLPRMVCDYRFFYERKVPEQILELAVNKFIEYAPDNVYLAFLWPSGKKRRDEAEALFSNILYKKKIKLTQKGAFNLLANLYEGMDWVGNKNDGYPGVNQKLVECFPEISPCTVIAFQAENLSDVRLIKEQVRSIYNIGFSSIHITDSKSEAIKIANLLFNENGLHFLNHASPFKYAEMYDVNLKQFKAFLIQNNINKSEVLIDGSSTLVLYGIRKSEDIDFLITDNDRIANPSKEFDLHDQELIFHKKDKLDLILNPKYHFIFDGLKFISFEQLYSMKLARNQNKDINDCVMMQAFVTNKKSKQLIADLKQKILYAKTKFNRLKAELFYGFLKKTGLYAPIRHVYYMVKSDRKKNEDVHHT